MANTLYIFVSHSVTWALFTFTFTVVQCQNTLVFQPSFVTATGPVASAFLLGNTSNVSLSVRTVSPSNTTGSLGPPSCAAEATQWLLTREQVGKTAVKVQLRLNRSLRLCGENETETEPDCCIKPLCVLETIQVSACVGDTPQASLLIQARIHALLLLANAGSVDNKTIIPNQVYQPLGPCPCDLTPRSCNVRCCCDQDCSSEDLKLFASHCLPGPFGGHVSPPPDYQCSVQSSKNSPDWFPFLCVQSPPENNPFLGLFYRGNVIKPKPGPSFQMPALSAPVPVNDYIEGSPILTLTDQYLTIPRRVLGLCADNAPVAFLKNFKVECVTLLRNCPTGSPLQTRLVDLRSQVKDGQGGAALVEVTEEVATDLSRFIPSTKASSADSLVCENVTLALDYKFYWKENGITNITVTRTVGSVPVNGSVALTTRYSATFLNGEITEEQNSGNPGYQVGKPVIGGIMDFLADNNNTGSIQRTSFNLWKSGSDGLCSTNEKKPVLFGENSTSGCLLPISGQNLTQCDLLKVSVMALQDVLTAASYVAGSGNPDPLTMTDWVNVSYVTLNSSTTPENTTTSCSGIPAHQHIRVWSQITGRVEGIPQREILALQVSYSVSIWSLDCGGGDISLCEDHLETQLYPITSSVTFIDIPVNTGPPKTRFQINFTEYDCNRNDVCWPELAFPITRYYTGEPYSQALAKGLILVFFFIAASVLGTPWRQIRQVWETL